MLKAVCSRHCHYMTRLVLEIDIIPTMHLIHVNPKIAEFLKKTIFPVHPQLCSYNKNLLHAETSYFNTNSVVHTVYLYLYSWSHFFFIPFMLKRWYIWSRYQYIICMQDVGSNAAKQITIYKKSQILWSSLEQKVRNLPLGMLNSMRAVKEGIPTISTHWDVGNKKTTTTGILTIPYFVQKA